MKSIKFVNLRALFFLALLRGSDKVESSAFRRHRGGTGASTHGVTMTTPLEKNGGFSASFVERNRSARVYENRSKNIRETKVESLDAVESIHLESRLPPQSSAINPFPRSSSTVTFSQSSSSSGRQKRSRKPITHSHAGANSFDRVSCRNYSFHLRNYSQHLHQVTLGGRLKSAKNNQTVEHRIRRLPLGRNLGGKIPKRIVRNDFESLNDRGTAQREPVAGDKTRKRVEWRAKIRRYLSSARFKTVSTKASSAATSAQKQERLTSSRPSQPITATPPDYPMRIRHERHVRSSPDSKEDERSENCSKTLEKEIICCTTEFVQLLGNFMMPREIFASEKHLRSICRLYHKSLMCLHLVYDLCPPGTDHLDLMTFRIGHVRDMLLGPCEIVQAARFKARKEGRGKEGDDADDDVNDNDDDDDDDKVFEVRRRDCLNGSMASKQMENSLDDSLELKRIKQLEHSRRTLQYDSSTASSSSSSSSSPRPESLPAMESSPLSVTSRSFFKTDTAWENESRPSQQLFTPSPSTSSSSSGFFHATVNTSECLPLLEMVQLLSSSSSSSSSQPSSSSSPSFQLQSALPQKWLKSSLSSSSPHLKFPSSLIYLTFWTLLAGLR